MRELDFNTSIAVNNWILYAIEPGNFTIRLTNGEYTVTRIHNSETLTSDENFGFYLEYISHVPDFCKGDNFREYSGLNDVEIATVRQELVYQKLQGTQVLSNALYYALLFQPTRPIDAVSLLGVLT